MRTIVVGILYQGVETYLPDYFESILKQSTNNFELWLFNNSSELFLNTISDLLEKIKERRVTIKLLDISSLQSSFEARKYVIDILKESPNIDNVIFTDTDDYYDYRRFELAIEGLEKNDFVFNSLTPFDSETGEKYSPTSPKKEITFFDMVKKSVLGYNNTAVKAKCLERVLPFVLDSTPKVTDWFLYTSLLLSETKAVLMEGTTTYYRQYQKNTAGLRRCFTPEQILFGIEVKLNHYQKLFPHLSDEQKKIVQLESEKIKELKKQLSVKEVMEQYSNKINEVSEESFFSWWEQIDLAFLKN